MLARIANSSGFVSTRDIRRLGEVAGRRVAAAFAPLAFVCVVAVRWPPRNVVVKLFAAFAIWTRRSVLAIATPADHIGWNVLTLTIVNKTRVRVPVATATSACDNLVNLQIQNMLHAADELLAAATYAVEIFFADVAAKIEQIVAQCVQLDEHDAQICDAQKTGDFLKIRSDSCEARKSAATIEPVRTDCPSECAD